MLVQVLKVKKGTSISFKPRNESNFDAKRVKISNPETRVSATFKPGFLSFDNAGLPGFLGLGNGNPVLISYWLLKSNRPEWWITILANSLTAIMHQ
jgi:hypothetical protein